MFNPELLPIAVLCDPVQASKDLNPTAVLAEPVWHVDNEALPTAVF